jgi:dihydroflavonol-4-reductase
MFYPKYEEEQHMILITGAAGHLGNVLARELIKKGNQVRGLVLPGENLAALDGLDLEIVEGDVLDFSSLQSAMKGVEMVFHMAGIISIMPGRDNLMRMVNVEGTKNVIRAAREAGVRRLVYTSSIHALSRDCKGKIDECVPFDPHNPAGEYDRTKAEASLAVLDAVKDGLDAVVVCPTGVIGPYDFRDSEMGTLLRDWLRKKMHLLIEGEFDFVDVRDVARGHILAAEHGRTGEVYLLSGTQIKMFRLKQLVQTAAGIRTATIMIPNWLAKIATRVSPLYYRLTNQVPKFTDYSLETVQSNSDVSHLKAKRELGYQPRKIAATVADTVRWWLSKGDKSRVH